MRGARGIVWGALVTGLLATFLFLFDRQAEEAHGIHRRAEILSLLSTIADRLEVAVASRIFLTQGLIAHVAFEPTLVDAEFQNLASNLASRVSGIRSIQLAKDAVISHVYPLRGNEAAMGLRLLEQPEQKEAANQALVRREGVLAGPIQLVQGGRGLVHRAPIHLTPPGKPPGSGSFWGFASVVMELPILLAEAGLEEDGHLPGLRVALRGKDGLGPMGAVFLGDPGLFDQNPVTVEIFLQSGSWQLGGIPEGGWGQRRPQAALFLLFGLVGCVMGGILAWFLARIPERQAQAVKRATAELESIREHLEEMVAARTASLSQLNHLLNEDIARRRQVEEGLRKLTRAVEESPATVVVTNRQGVIEYVNPKFTEISGYTREEALGRTPAILKSGQTPDDTYEEMWWTLLERNTWRGEFVNRRKDGSIYWELASISPLLDEAGEITHFVAVKEDITAMKKMAVHLKETKEAAEEANRAKSRFLAGMSHELRTPLNAILGFGQLLEDDPDHPLAPAQLEWVRHSLRAGEHLLSLINQILDLSKIEAGRVELAMASCPVHPVMDEALRLTSVLAERHGVTIRDHRTPDSTAAIRADPVRLRQILLNLLANAVKYNRPRGEVGIHCETRDNRLLRLTITDQGPGIPEAMRHAVFEAFNRLQAERTQVEGTGLGLSLSRQLAEMMGGRIGFTSEVGHGSAFWVEFPRLRAADETLAPSVQSQRKTASTELAGRILYVEDHPANRTFMEILLRRQGPGLRLMLAADGEEGIACALANPPDLILMDINLPRMDGFETVARMRAHPTLASVPVVAITADVMPDTLERGRQAGFADFVSKPFRVEVLLEILRRHLG